MAARSLITLYREKNPSLLHRNFRVTFVDFKAISSLFSLDISIPVFVRYNASVLFLQFLPLKRDMACLIMDSFQFELSYIDLFC